MHVPRCLKQRLRPVTGAVDEVVEDGNDRDRDHGDVSTLHYCPPYAGWPQGQDAETQGEEEQP